jgi:hypothetical protein
MLFSVGRVDPQRNRPVAYRSPYEIRTRPGPGAFALHEEGLRTTLTNVTGLNPTKNDGCALLCIVSSSSIFQSISAALGVADEHQFATRRRPIPPPSTTAKADYNYNHHLSSYYRLFCRQY